MLSFIQIVFDILAGGSMVTVGILFIIGVFTTNSRQMNAEDDQVAQNLIANYRATVEQLTTRCNKNLFNS